MVEQEAKQRGGTGAPTVKKKGDDTLPSFLSDSQWHKESDVVVKDLKDAQKNDIVNYVNRVATDDEKNLYDAAETKSNEGQTLSSAEEEILAKVIKGYVASKGEYKYVVPIGKVELKSIKFLGRAIPKGVSDELIEVLKDAQIEIYKEYNRQTNDSSEKGFTDWCGMKEDHRGFRNDKPYVATSYHNKATAIDINYYTNPFVAIRKKNGDIYFEGNLINDSSWNKKKNPQKRQKAKEKVTNIRRAVTAYDNAVQFVCAADETAKMYEKQPEEKIGKAYDRFYRVSEAVKTYFSMVYEPWSKNILDDDDFDAHELKPVEEFLQNVLNAWEANECYGLKNKQFVTTANEELYGGPSTNGMEGLASDWENIDFVDWIRSGNEHKIQKDYLEDPPWRYNWSMQQENINANEHPCLVYLVEVLYPQIKDDHAAMRWIMPIGSGIAQTRDPCKGFLNIRKEVVTLLYKAMKKKTSKARWGAVDFGKMSGDIMHFDLGEIPIKYINFKKEE